MMPELFFKRELEGRKHVYNEMITAKSKILFSSNDALQHFKSFYPHAQNKMYVVNFAVTHPKFSHINLEVLNKKYQIQQSYFLVPNQFWIHKNHKVVLEAALLLKNEGVNYKILFTGRENDFRAPEYTQELKQFVFENDLTNMVSFLGFIPREEQLCLMQNSIAIIQPSLFEGWSTVVEDAKAINKRILLSDIPVHREQINENVSFFQPKQPNQLADLMKLNLRNPPNVLSSNYQRNIINFGQGFFDMLCD
jgi:glycosyltransferase involved in cell wall biosynthesis